MSSSAAVVQTGAFAGRSAASRFRMVREPANGEVRGTVIWAHAFAEEMNKTRRMSALLARRLAGAGWRVVQRDLRGCGDSAGEFRDASWADWISDLQAEVRAAHPGRPIWLWCVRAGALLAPEVLAGRPDAHLLLWQPVMSGAQHLQQFLRLQAGARIVGAATAADPTPAQALRSGATVEVGGYEITPALAAGLERARFDVPAGHLGRIVWFEVTADDIPTLSPAASRALDQWRERGLGVVAEALHGPLFWQTVEIERCDALIERSLARLDDAGVDR